MARNAAAAPQVSTFSSLEAAVRLTLKSLSAPATSEHALEVLEAEQARIRNSSRHWLLG